MEPITISDYLAFVNKTDRLPKDNSSAALHGLFGEVGGIMTAAKKLHRDQHSKKNFYNVALEEFGDAFWYLCCFASRIDVDMTPILIELTQSSETQPNVVISSGQAPLSLAYTPGISHSFEQALDNLGKLAGDFLNPHTQNNDQKKKIMTFLSSYFDTMSLLDIHFGKVISFNITKVSSRFIRPNNAELPIFDWEFPEYERLPEEFEVEFVQRTPRQKALRMNNVFIGDPLTDNIELDDGYRFHDVFHFAYAAILHWSPTLRSLLKHKRKSDPKVDENQDGGRAIVIEEGLAAWLFAIAKEQELFKNETSLSFDLLKNVGQFVKGYEVEQCPLILWEEAILEGFKVFRQVLENDGGIITGNRHTRTIEYRKTK